MSNHSPTTAKEAHAAYEVAREAYYTSYEQDTRIAAERLATPLSSPTTVMAFYRCTDAHLLWLQLVEQEQRLGEVA